MEDGEVGDVDDDDFDFCAAAPARRRAASLGPVTLTLALCLRDNDTVRATATSGAVWLDDVGGFMAIGFGFGLAGGIVFSSPCSEDGSVVERSLGPRTRVDAERPGRGLLLIDDVWDIESV